MDSFGAHCLVSHPKFIRTDDERTTKSWSVLKELMRMSMEDIYAAHEPVELRYTGNAGCSDVEPTRTPPSRRTPRITGGRMASDTAKEFLQRSNSTMKRPYLFDYDSPSTLNSLPPNTTLSSDPVNLVYLTLRRPGPPDQCRVPHGARRGYAQLREERKEFTEKLDMEQMSSMSNRSGLLVSALSMMPIDDDAAAASHLSVHLHLHLHSYIHLRGAKSKSKPVDLAIDKEAVIFDSGWIKKQVHAFQQAR
ncbi:hypothetical protein HGRIS_011467 [Hohenbuehelia grisea]|uniref:Uncharacterized protein n=1 Tax=Hohenbuehelia grisea TaxID=104357 RepID=A0ABR3JXD0_9AGAR